MQNETLLLTYDVREYARGSVSDRHHFESPAHHDVLVGEAQATGTELYQSVYLHSDAIRRFVELQHSQTGTRSISGYSGSVCADVIHLDLDNKSDLEYVRREAVRLLERLELLYGIDPDSLKICFSGQKGFHIEIPAAVFGGFSASKELPDIHEAIVSELTEGFEKLIDASIYRTTALLRVPNTIHKATSLYAIPLTFKELSELSVEVIKELASKGPRIIDTGNVPLRSYTKLIEIKQRAENKVIQKALPKATLATESNPSGPATDIAGWDKMYRHCGFMKEIHRKSLTGELITHEERVSIGCIAQGFGEPALAKIHELLKSQENYNKEKTEYYARQMISKGYKPTVCNTICGAKSLCANIKAIGKRSPVAFAYSYDPSVDQSAPKYTESYFAEKFLRNFTDLIYSVQYDAFYMYRDGVHSEISDDALKSMFNAFLPFYLPKAEITNKRLNDLKERIKTFNHIRYTGSFNVDPYLVNVRNGLFDLRTGELSPHDAAQYSTIQLPFEYDKRADAPLFGKTMDEIFLGNEAVIDYMLKTFCYLLIPTYSFQKVFVWQGTGRNGKGLLSRVLTAILGARNVANEDLHTLTTSNGRFLVGNLKDKLVNFSSELKTDDLDLALIKRLSGEDDISADVKHRNVITFRNHARLIIQTNRLPRFSELGTAVLERFEFVQFPHEFTGNGADTGLEAKLVAELPGIFNVIVAKASEIIRPSDHAISFDSPSAVKQYRTAALSKLNTAVEFVEEVCTKSGDTKVGSIRLSTVHQTYRAWCERNGYRALGKSQFRDVLTGTLGFRIDRESGDHNQVHVYGIIGLTDELSTLGYRLAG